MIETEAYRALSSRSRLEILKLLYRKPMSVEDIAQRLNLQPITIRHHLQPLVESGFVEPTEERAGAVGRPKILYTMVKDPPLLNYPKRQYLMLSTHLLNTLKDTLGESKTGKILRRAGLEMGEKTAKRLESEHDIKEWTLKVYEQFFIKDYLEKVGAEPEVVEVSENKIVYRLHNCLFFEMATRMPRIMCDVLHESFHEAITRAIGKDVEINRITCISKGDDYCEHSIEWRA